MPDALVDGHLLKLFGYHKTLDEIDEMDIGRFMRAIEAMNIAHMWEVYHSDAPLKEKAKYSARIFELKKLVKDGE